MLRILKHLDLTLLLAVGTLIFIAIFMIYSASITHTDNNYSALLSILKYLFSLGIGTLCFLLFMSFNYRSLANFWWLFYLSICGLLLYVLFFGHYSQGAQRWINLGSFIFQPSEPAKLVIIIALAAILRKQQEIISITQLLPSLILISIPFLLVARQPDLGTALVFLGIYIGMLIMANTSSKLLLLFLSPLVSLAIFVFFPYQHYVVWILYLIILAMVMIHNKTPLFDIIVIMALNLLVVIIVPYFWQLLKPYQQNRLMAFANPNIDPLAQGIRYHVDKSVTAVGSGGIWGHGWLKGPLSHLQYIPVQNADFIFSVIAEEIGLWGSSIVLFLLAVLSQRTIKIASIANDYFGSLLAAGIASLFLFQILVNIGMTMGIMPVVGIPLPFLSYGGSALVTNLAAIGLLENITCRCEKLIF